MSAILVSPRAIGTESEQTAQLLICSQMANIDDLPNELLLMILDCLIASMSPQRRTVSRYFKHFNPLGIFSLVCRRFRAIALPFLYCDLEFDDWRDFANAISKFPDDAAYDPQCVRQVIFSRVRFII